MKVKTNMCCHHSGDGHCENRNKFRIGFTELITKFYTRPTASGGEYSGIKTIGAINHYSNGTKKEV